MDPMYLFYFLLGIVIFFGAEFCGRGWNGEATSLRQTTMLRGIAAAGVMLHHMGQKTCAPWHPRNVIVHGLDFFVPIGTLFVGIFLFCSGMGLFKSLKAKPDYLRGFLRRRIVPILVVFFVSEAVYLAVRLAMGQRMSLLDGMLYLLGLHMANPNAWYVIVIPFFYLFFWLAFRLCRRDGTAIMWVTLAVLAYTLLGASLDHSAAWWMCGEWWYNSMMLFPLGMLFAKYEERVLDFFRKGYWLWLAVAFTAMLLLQQLNALAADSWWGYYGETWGDPLKVIHRLGCTAMQWLACLGVVVFCGLLMMKFRIGNRILAFLGGLSLELYLIHGLFVELFGYDFMEFTQSLYYIKHVPLYLVVVTACSLASAVLLRQACRPLIHRLAPRGGLERRLPAAELREREEQNPGAQGDRGGEQEQQPDAEGVGQNAAEHGGD